MQAICPKNIVVGNRGFNLAGKGRAPGSVAYMSPATGQLIDLYYAQIVEVTRLYAQCRVANNNALPLIRVANSLLNGSCPIRLGTFLLIGPLQFHASGPRAKAAWPAQVSIRHASNDRIGTIRAVKPKGYGFIRPADGSPDVFFHASELRGFDPLIGRSVVYQPVFDVRGWKALNVRPI